MKKMICALLCLVMLIASLPVMAFADSAYSRTSNTGVDLVYPSSKYYLDTPMRATVKASKSNGSIYFMPMPKSGNGHLGTVRNGTEVTILAEKSGYYFFVTDDGREGWNGTKFFTNLYPADYDYSGNSYSGGGSSSRSSGSGCPVSTTGDELQPPSSRYYLSYPLTAEVVASRANGSIYLMPMPQSGHGNLGTVKNGSIVTILAEKSGFYYFRTADGREGWNGKGYFYVY